MSENHKAEQAPWEYSVPNTPCCGSPTFSVECRFKADSDSKCGVVPDTFDGPGIDPRFYREVTGSITVHMTASRDYTDGDFSTNPPEAHVEGSADCTHTMSASVTGCTGGEHVLVDWTDSWDITLGQLGGLDTTATGSGSGGGETTARGCYGQTDLLLGTGAQPTWPGFVSEFDGAVIPAATPSGGGDPITYTLSYTDSRTGSANPGAPDEYMFNENLVINGTLTFSNEFTTTELIEQVEEAAEEDDWSEWGDSDDCCSSRDMEEDEVTYTFVHSEFRINYVPPCSGIVRFTYTLITTVPDEDPDEETFTVDNPVPGAAIDLPAPTLGTGDTGLFSLCLGSVTAEFI